MGRSLSSLLLLFIVAILLVSPADALLGGGGSGRKKRRHKKKKGRRRRHKKKSDSSSSSSFNHGRINRRYEDLTAQELLEYLTVESGPNKGFEILLQLIELSELDPGILEDFTLFAPNDNAFCRTARNDFNYDGECTPEKMLEFYGNLLSGLGRLQDTLVAILTYHAASGQMTVKDLREKGSFITYCECFEIEVKKQSKRTTKLYDAGRKYPNIEFRQQNIAVADDGMVHVIKSVLLPPLNTDCPPGGGNDCLFAPQKSFVCGDLDCKYNSACDFQAAGFKRSECTQVDEEYQCGSDCNTDKECESGVVGLGGCRYCAEGKCSARPAVEYQCESVCSTDKECESGVQGDGGCPYCASGKCRSRPDEFPCGFECIIDEQCADRANANGACPYCTEGICSWSRFGEVLECGSNCVTNEQCRTGVSGLGGCPYCAAGECKSRPESCPNPVGGSCTTEIRQVACGDSNCRYSNQCLATLAGFTDVECKRIGPASCGSFCVYEEDCISAGTLLSGCDRCIQNTCSLLLP